MKKFFKQIFAFIKAESKQLRSVISNIANELIEVAENLKEALDNPKFDLLVKLTETKTDDKILAALRSALSQLFPDAENSKKVFDVSKAVNSISSLPKPLQQAAIAKTTSLMLHQLTKETVGKGKSKKELATLTISECDTIMQLAYKQYAIKLEDNPHLANVVVVDTTEEKTEA